jgi:tetratricopeptide (TPR) repeat protein
VDNDAAHQHYLRALELEEADRRAARAAYESCLAGDCRHLEARINLGRLLHLEGLHAAAESIYRDAQETDAVLLFNLAVLSEDQGRMGDAIRYYLEAIAHDPGMSDAHFNLSILYESAGDEQRAYRHLLAYHRLVEAHNSPATFDSASEEHPDGD